MISAVILTLNEEKNIAQCIDTLHEWCDDVVVYDSYSTDHTQEIAQAHGARVFKRHFDNYAAQRNAALNEVEYQNPWIVMVDADERWGKTMGDFMLQAVADERYKNCTLFHFQRKDIFFGRWLKHNIGNNTWSGRLLKKGFSRVARDINEEYETSGEKVYLAGERFLHYPFNNGINWWFWRHNRYSDMEAVRLLAERREKVAWTNLWGRDPVARRKAFKQLLYRLPCRPILMFVVLYFLKRGFLDGAPGFHYSLMRSIYEYMIDLKIKEQHYLEAKQHDLP